MKKRFLWLFFLNLTVLSAIAQEIEFVDAVLDEPNNTIEIVFNLDAKGADKAFDVRLYYSNDGGKTFKGPVERVSGQIGQQVNEGSNLKIYWNYFYEDEEFTGENLVFSIRAKEIVPLMNEGLMGPKAALYSVLVPGLGDYKVRTGKSYWLITTGTWGLLGASLIARSGAKNDYNSYLNAQDLESANVAFDKADSKFKTFRALSTIAILGWAADVAGVYLKGKKNEREGLTACRYQLNWDLAMSPDGRTPLAGINITF